MQERRGKCNLDKFTNVDAGTTHFVSTNRAGGEPIRVFFRQNVSRGETLEANFGVPVESLPERYSLSVDILIAWISQCIHPLLIVSGSL